MKRRIVALVSLAMVAGAVGFYVGYFRESAPGGRLSKGSPSPSPVPSTFTTLWVSDFKGNRVFAVDRTGEVVWEQYMASAPIPPRSANVHVEYVTVAPDGNLIVADGEGMMVQELDRKTHAVVWQYGVRSVQGYEKGFLHQPDKAYKVNDHEVLINDGNNRRVIIVDQRTNDVVWQYGKTLVMGSSPGLLRGNTHAVAVNDGREILITDTLEKKLLLVDRESQRIVWEWRKPDAKWLQHVFPTPKGTFILEDRQKNEVFEVNREGQILWTLSELADGARLRYPTDAMKLGNGNILIAVADRGRIIEVSPTTREVVWQYGGGSRLGRSPVPGGDHRSGGVPPAGGDQPTPRASAGFPTTIAIDPFDVAQGHPLRASQSDQRSP